MDESVGFFGMLLIGFLAGYIAEKALNREHGLFTNILVGIAGSFVGGTLADVLGLDYRVFSAIWWWPPSEPSSSCGCSDAPRRAA